MDRVVQVPKRKVQIGKRAAEYQLLYMYFQTVPWWSSKRFIQLSKYGMCYKNFMLYARSLTTGRVCYAYGTGMLHVWVRVLH